MISLYYKYWHNFYMSICEKCDKVRDAYSKRIGIITRWKKPFCNGVRYEVDFLSVKEYIKEPRVFVTSIQGICYKRKSDDESAEEDVSRAGEPDSKKTRGVARMLFNDYLDDRQESL